MAKATTQNPNPATLQPRTERPVQEAYDELIRELQVRDRCYPGWVKDQRVTASDARDRYDRLASAIIWLERAYPAVGTSGATNDGQY